MLILCYVNVMSMLTFICVFQFVLGQQDSGCAIIYSSALMKVSTVTEFRIAMIIVTRNQNAVSKIHSKNKPNKNEQKGIKTASNKEI